LNIRTLRIVTTVEYFAHHPFREEGSHETGPYPRALAMSIIFSTAKALSYPTKSGGAVETIVLIPMGCARLRISAFPTVD